MGLLSTEEHRFPAARWGRRGPFAARWEGWEGTSHFVIFDPAGACAGHLNFNKKHIAGG